MTIANIQGITSASKGLMTGVKKAEAVSSFSSVTSETSYQKSYTKSYSTNNYSAASVTETSAGGNGNTSNTKMNQGGQTTEKADSTKDDKQKLVKDSSKTSKQDKDAVDTSDVSETSSNPVDEETKDNVAVVVDEIRSMVQETLGLSDEDMTALMGELHLTDEDLLNPDNVLKLVMEQNGLNSTMDILNNEELASMVKDLMKDMDAVKADILPEQLTMLVKSASEGTATVNQAPELNLGAAEPAELSEDDVMQNLKISVEGDAGAVKQDAGAHTSQQSFQQHAGGEFHEQPVLTSAQTVFEGLTQAVDRKSVV